MSDTVSEIVKVLAVLSGAIALLAMFATIHGLIDKVAKIEKAVKDLDPGADL